MRILFVLIFILLSFLFYGLFLNHYDIHVLPQAIKPLSTPLFYDYRGAMNIHTDRGLGRRSAHRVMEAARAAGIDFVIFTDLNTLGSRTPVEGYYGRTLAIEGAMYSYVESRLIFLSEDPLPEFSSLSQAQVFLADLVSQPVEARKNSVIILAHPLKKGYEWSGELPVGINGIEILNFKSIWQRAWEKAKASFLVSFFIYPFHGSLALLRIYHEPSEELELWSELNRGRKVNGFLGHQATARTRDVFGGDFDFPSYELSFSIASTHVLLKSELTGQYRKDRTKIIEALRDGNSYVALDLLGNPQGFEIYLKKNDALHLPGVETTYAKNMILHVGLPQKPTVPFEIVIFKDGQEIKSIKDHVVFDFAVPSKGVYRAQVRVHPSLPLPERDRWFTWIYTNPFYIR